jgi:hypothetical protein
MAERNFDSEYPASEEAHTFVLCGQEFHVTPNLHPALFLEQSEGIQGVAGLVAFVQGCLITDAERESFDAIVKDPTTKITADQLGNIVTWIIEVISDRPTNAPASSGDTGAVAS